MQEIVPEEAERADPAELYGTLETACDRLADTLTTAVVDPAARRQFEADRGHGLREVLPDGSDVYIESSASAPPHRGRG